MTIERVFVGGAGLMGHGIAQVLAAAGRDVILYEPEIGRAEAGRERIAANLERAAARRRLTADERDAILARVHPTDDPATVGDADAVIEAIFEDLAVKRAFWAGVDRHARPDAVLASNTSSIAIDSLAEAVEPARRPRFVGMHFFSPVPVMPLVELVRGSATSDATADAVADLAADLGKRLIVSADRPGFIVNRMLMPYLAEAMRALEEGVASAADIDTGAKVGLNHPMGPLELADFIGLDVCRNIMLVLHEGLGGEQFRPPRVLEELVDTGHLGQKTGRGFHAYPKALPEPSGRRPPA
jgi:3-hydroxybutyryl-CoA dehydrogenase